MELAANFIGEALIFGVAATGLILDSLRTNAKERAKERQISEHFDELQDQIKALTQEVHSLKGSDTKSVIQSEPVEIKEKPKSIWDRIFNRH